MTKREFYYMAQWISQNTDPRTSDRLMCLQFARDVGKRFNQRFDDDRFGKAVERYDVEESEEKYEHVTMPED